MNKIVLFLILASLIAIFSNIGTILIFVLAYLSINVLIRALDDQSVYKNSHKVYQTIFFSSALYMLLCLIYMRMKGYDYLLVFDTHNVIMPYVQEFLGHQHYGDMLSDIWSRYNFFDRFQAGFYTFLTFWAFLGRFLGADIYISVQIGLLSACSLTPMLIYKILRLSDLDENKSVKYAIIIGICSVLFYYTNIILRDGLIALLLVYIFYIMKHPMSTVNIIKILIALYLMTTLRIETGLLSLIFVPAYIFIWTNNSTYRIIAIASGLVLMVVGIILLNSYFGAINALYEANYEYYTEDVQNQDRVIGTLQSLPPVINDVASILFIALLPIPCWAKMLQTGEYAQRPECYNIMNFPMIIYAFFGLYIIISLFTYFVKRHSYSKNEHIRFLLILLMPGAVFLGLQSAVTTQRRIMGVYVLFYLIWAIMNSESSIPINKRILNLSAVVFALIQIAASIYYYF